jgi:hypothetical protein
MDTDSWSQHSLTKLSSLHTAAQRHASASPLSSISDPARGMIALAQARDLQGQPTG